MPRALARPITFNLTEVHWHGFGLRLRSAVNVTLTRNGAAAPVAAQAGPCPGRPRPGQTRTRHPAAENRAGDQVLSLPTSTTYSG